MDNTALFLVSLLISSWCQIPRARFVTRVQP